MLDSGRRPCDNGRTVHTNPAAPPAAGNIEPLYSLDVACELIPFPSKPALYNFLSNHRAEFPGLYRRQGGTTMARCGFEQRFLTESEILLIREMTLHDFAHSRYALMRGGHRAPRLSSPIARIMRLAHGNS